MILVTSAAGNTGGIIVNKLIEAGYEVAATDIDPKVKEIPGIKQAFVGDLTDLSFIREMLSQVERVVYIPPLFSAQEALIGKQLVDSAVEFELAQFIFMSVTHPILTSLWQHVAKRDVEEHLIYRGMETQLPYTILQPMHYMHNFKPEVVKETKEYQIFYDPETPVAYVDTEDVAEVLRQVIDDPKTHDKATYELVGTPAYSPKQLVAMFNEVFKEKAEAVYVPVTDFLDQVGINDLYFREAFIHLADTYSKWGLDGNSHILSLLLGRKPTGFKEYLERSK